MRTKALAMNRTKKTTLRPSGEKATKILLVADVPIGIICDFDFTFDKLNFKALWLKF
jgi:hypothetical protein